MIRRFLFLGVLAAATAFAQWQVSAVSTVSGCTPVCGPAFDLGVAQTGGTVSVPFRLANVGTAAVTLYLLDAQGAGFSVNSATAIPITILPLSAYPNGYFEFNIVFHPTVPGGASAIFHVNTTSFTVTATAQGSGPSTDLPLSLDPAALDFGKTFRGTSAAPKTLTVTNSNTQQVVVDTLSVTGQAFQCPSCEPMTLASNQSVTLTIGWQPAGIDHGTLTVNRQTVSLTGTAVDPPAIADITADRALASGQQANISVRFASAAQATGSGLLKLDFTGKGDAGRGFIVGSTLTSSVPFTIAEGQDTAAPILLQTGTTAGQLTLTATLGDETKSVDFQIAPTAAGIDSVRATRGATGVLVTVTGFDNTRSMSQASFTFYDISAQSIATFPTIDVTSAFQTYFQNSGTGAFVLRAAFPVTGSVTQIGSVAVQLTNSAGTSPRVTTILE